MAWYKNMTEQQKKDFKKIIAVCAVGAIVVLLVPMCFHFVF